MATEVAAEGDQNEQACRAQVAAGPCELRALTKSCTLLRSTGRLSPAPCPGCSVQRQLGPSRAPAPTPVRCGDRGRADYASRGSATEPPESLLELEATQ